MTSLIYLAFRFHGNFYHSYRGDTPDELGFGKDIGILRHLVAALDHLNASGIPVPATWDFENYFSLQTIMPQYCPDLIAALQRRVRENGDEMELMAYNNGLMSGHTAREFEEAIRRGVTNAAGSGLRDLFGEGYRPIVRPQEMMWTPVHLKLYRACGIETISLYYSALPFNGFSNFVPPLSLLERYNPLTLSYPGIEETMTLLPCYSVGDLADHLTLRRWIKQIRRGQLALPQPADLLLLIDMDADDEFWVGYDVPLLKGRFSTISGLRGLVKNVAGLDYVRFTTPGAYLDEHAPVGTVSFGQDTADGAFDGYSSWAEKWSNHQMWTGIERARILDLQARRLAGEQMSAEVASLLNESFEARLKVLSTTHFGMAAPVMNLTREAIGRNLVSQAVRTAAEAFARVASKPVGASFSLLDYVRGESTATITYAAHPSTSLIRLPVQDPNPGALTLTDASGRVVPSAILRSDGRAELVFVDRFEPCERKDYTLSPAEPAMPSPCVILDHDGLRNERLSVGLDQKGHVNSVQLDGEEFALGRFPRSGITYAGKHYEVDRWTATSPASPGALGVKDMRGSLGLPGENTVSYARELMLAVGLPYLYVSTRVHYPRTVEKGYSRGKAKRLQQAWDARWQEVWPCEIRPNLLGTDARPLRVWKHNYCDHVSSFTLDYGQYSRNDELESVNNQVTHGWMAVSDGERGMLVAYSVEAAAGMAFCPLRTRRDEAGMRVRLNPFGTHWGKQYHYGTADTGLGKFIATVASASDHITSYAPSYNGRRQDFRLMIVPYKGDAPPEAVRYAAEAFAYPSLVLGDERMIALPAHRRWQGEGLGEPPWSDRHLP